LLLKKRGNISKKEKLPANEKESNRLRNSQWLEFIKLAWRSSGLFNRENPIQNFERSEVVFEVILSRYCHYLHERIFYAQDQVQIQETREVYEVVSAKGRKFS
jgi:hypothetical protein